MIYLQKNIKNKENVVTAPQTQGIFRKYIGWVKVNTKMTSTGKVVIDWESYTVEDLRDLAAQFDIPNTSRMKRDELIKVLRREKKKLKNLNKNNN
jgi:hypothetical protein